MVRMVQVYGVCTVDNLSEDYMRQQTLRKGLSSNKLISTCIAISLFVFFGVIIAERNDLFEEFIPTLRGEINLPDNYIITSIDQTYPILIKKSDPKIAEQLRYKGHVISVFDRAARQLYTEGDVVAEVGAHYGYNAIMLGNLLKTNGKYIAIEGNPSVAKCLYKNMVLNDLSNVVEVLQIAVSDHEGVAVIDDIVSASKGANGSVTVSTRNIQVRSNTLDNLLNEKKVTFVLMDVPSTAFQVLRGANNLISESEQIKFLVRLDLERVDNQEEARQDLLSLNNRGLRFYEITPASTPKEISVDEIMEQKKVVVLMRKEK